MYAIKGKEFAEENNSIELYTSFLRDCGYNHNLSIEERIDYFLRICSILEEKFGEDLRNNFILRNLHDIYAQSIYMLFKMYTLTENMTQAKKHASKLFKYYEELSYFNQYINTLYLEIKSIFNSK